MVGGLNQRAAWRILPHQNFVIGRAGGGAPFEPHRAGGNACAVSRSAKDGFGRFSRAGRSDSWNGRRRRHGRNFRCRRSARCRCCRGARCRCCRGARCCRRARCRCRRSARCCRARRSRTIHHKQRDGRRGKGGVERAV
ncbi:MAG: hypothetical protein DCC52_16575 [Chloroflexi bacterium]|nr:MAG: hypothetical protein DCC52_16575 [Chloroflexota bacterium]